MRFLYWRHTQRDLSTSMSTSNSIDGIKDAEAMSSTDGSGVQPVSWDQTKSNLMDWTKGMCSWASEHQEYEKLGISSSILSLSHLNVNFGQAWVILCLDGAEWPHRERGRQGCWNLKKLAWHVSCKKISSLVVPSGKSRYWYPRSNIKRSPMTHC